MYVLHDIAHVYTDALLSIKKDIEQKSGAHFSEIRNFVQEHQKWRNWIRHQLTPAGGINEYLDAIYAKAQAIESELPIKYRTLKDIAEPAYNNVTSFLQQFKNRIAPPDTVIDKAATALLSVLQWLQNATLSENVLTPLVKVVEELDKQISKNSTFQTNQEFLKNDGLLLRKHYIEIKACVTNVPKDVNAPSPLSLLEQSLTYLAKHSHHIDEASKADLQNTLEFALKYQQRKELYTHAFKVDERGKATPLVFGKYTATVLAQNSAQPAFKELNNNNANEEKDNTSRKRPALSEEAITFSARQKTGNGQFIAK